MLSEEIPIPPAGVIGLATAVVILMIRLVPAIMRRMEESTRKDRAFIRMLKKIYDIQRQIELNTRKVSRLQELENAVSRMNEKLEGEVKVKL